jgi:RND family efflux transporter MFP subunit
MIMQKNTFLKIYRYVVVGFLWLTVQGLHAQEYVGLVYSEHDIQLSAPVVGLVQRVLVRPGDRVSAGQSVIELEDSVQRIEVKRRVHLFKDNSELDMSVERLELASKLWKISQEVNAATQSISQEELLKMQMEISAAAGKVTQLKAQKVREQIELEASQADLGLRTLRAPVASVVTDVLIDPGEWAKLGDVILKLVDLSQVELRLNVPPTFAATLKRGDSVPAVFESAKGSTIVGVVKYVSPVVDSASGLVDVRIRYPNTRGEIRPGLKGAVRANRS